MKSLSLLSLTVALAVTGFIYSCASTDTGDFSAGTGSAGADSAVGGQGQSLGTGAGGVGSNKGTGASVGTGGTKAESTGTACGTADVESELTPIYMIFLYDSSGSMGVSGTTDNTALRWAPVTAGIKDFFTNAKAPNVQASIAFFPYPGGKVTTCTHDYSVPDIPLTALNTPQALISGLDLKVPEGGTPTLPAVYGGIKMAKQLLTDHPGSKAMVVLVTDGEPALIENGISYPDCAPEGVDLTNTIPNIATVVNAAYAGPFAIETHVIGIGTALTSLGQIATAGGTELLLINPSTDVTATTSAIMAKLSSIQTAQISCNIPIPKTAGFDSANVNVRFEHSDGTTVEQFKRSDECTVGGWRYDDAAAPKYIQLCPTTCDSIQDDLKGKIRILLGCPTQAVT